MRTVLVGELPPEVHDLLERRRALGQDLFDEVWEGEYHMVPAPHGQHGDVDDQLAQLIGPLARASGLRGSGPCNIGESNNHRVPDRAYFARGTTPRAFNPTAEIVVEIVSPGDESREKFDFYFQAGVTEVLIVDPGEHSVDWYTRADSTFRPTESSDLLGVSAAELAGQIDGPRPE
ncbi:Uma2 family endonuclease [Phytoactinopolyspora halotolerans]|uniref:Uma2 family endonuclease n=1 Tax=Phytoactinopolyspora halotolerans TaxID=1981512 RepID=A0A6L9S833_9ACTN|nr:Uma2 family endonuclease [Phytoactinopolyspora halotolerans]NEE00688.1 Uma2 family endonuclease [Phytoactinopolyspora halotolerans]